MIFNISSSVFTYSQIFVLYQIHYVNVTFKTPRTGGFTQCSKKRCPTIIWEYYPGGWGMNPIKAWTFLKHFFICSFCTFRSPVRNISLLMIVRCQLTKIGSHIHLNLTLCSIVTLFCSRNKEKNILISCYTRKSITTVLQFKCRLLLGYISSDL